MTRSFIWMALAASLAAARPAQAQDAFEAGAEFPEPEPPAARHLPVHDLPEGEPAILHFLVRHPQEIGELVVRHRPLGEGGPTREVVARRHEAGWSAWIPGDQITPPGLEYWVVRRDASGESPLFASPESPQPVHVREPDARRQERERLALRDGRRSRAILRGEYVDLGTRAVVVEDGRRQELREHYYQLEASYAYAFFQTVDAIRLSLGRMRGNVIRPGGEPSRDERGLDYGSAEITFRAHELVYLRTSVLFGFSQEGFEIGGAGDLVLGRREGTNLAFGVEGVTTLGASGRVRLGWLTVPRLPMGATVEVTTWPAGDAAGVRLLYDVAYELYPGAYARLEAGYRGWNSTTGGPSAAVEIALAF